MRLRIFLLSALFSLGICVVAASVFFSLCERAGEKTVHPSQQHNTVQDTAASYTFSQRNDSASCSTERCDSLRKLIRRLRAPRADSVSFRYIRDTCVHAPPVRIETLVTPAPREAHGYPSRDELSRLRSRIAECEHTLSRLRAEHTLRALFVYHGFVSQAPDSVLSDSLRHDLIQELTGLFGYFARLRGWNIAYCTAHKQVFSAQKRHYRYLRAVSDEYGYGPAPLFYLVKCDYVSPRTVTRAQTLFIVQKALAGFRREHTLAADTLRSLDAVQDREDRLHQWVRQQLRKMHLN
jgi:hypothetical protein